MIKILFKSSGFSLVELMIVVSIAGILLSVGLPSFQGAMLQNRLVTQVNSLVGALNVARSEAIKRNQFVVVQKSGTAWKEGWEVFVDLNANGTKDAGDSVIQQYEGITVNHINPSASYTNYIAYRPDGRSNANGHFYLCSPAAEAMFKRILIATSGRIRTESSENITGTPSAVTIYNDKCIE